MSHYKNLLVATRKRLIILEIKYHLARKNYQLATFRVKSALSEFPSDLAFLDIAKDVYVETRNWDDYYALDKYFDSLYPESLPHKRYSGSVYIGAYKYEEALPNLIYCTENWNLGPEFSETLANIYAQLAICYAFLEEWESFDNCLQQATKGKIWDPDIAFAQILQIIGTGNSIKLQGVLDEQISRHPRLHALYYWKANHLQYFLHNTGESIDWYVRALVKMNSFQPGERYWKYYLSTIKYSTVRSILKEMSEAAIAQNKYIQALCLIYLANISIWDIKIDVLVFKTYLNLLKNSIDKVENTCHSMLKRKLTVAQRIEYLLLLANAQSRRHKYDEAISTIRTALILDSEELESWLALAFYQYQANDWNSAILTYQKILKMNPFDFDSWSFLGSCYMNIDNLTSAQKSFEKAVWLNPQEANTWVDLANVYYKLGNNDLAMSGYQNGLKYEWLDAGKRQHALQMLEEIKSA